MSAMRSANSRASSRLWVTRIVVRRCSLWNARISVRTRRRLGGSRLLKGSSISMICGYVVMARASATRCCCPADSSGGLRSNSRSSMLRALASGRINSRMAPDGPFPDAQGKRQVGVFTVVEDAHVRPQRIALEDELHVPSPGRHVVHRHPADEDLARVGGFEAGDDAQQRGLAAAALADDDQELPLLHLDAEVVHGRHGEPKRLPILRSTRFFTRPWYGNDGSNTMPSRTRPFPWNGPCHTAVRHGMAGTPISSFRRKACPVLDTGPESRRGGAGSYARETETGP